MKAYNDVDQCMHILSQLLAKANRSFVPAEPDDAHTNLHFDPIGQRMIGRWIHSDKGLVLLSLNLERCRFEWVDVWHYCLKEFAFMGKTLREIEADIAAYLPELGLDSEDFIRPLHFQIPNYPFLSQAFPHFDPETLQYWNQIRTTANQACRRLIDYLQVEAEVRIWPHHFDTGIYVALEQKLGVGFGFAMQDTIAQAPYFYMSGYALKGKISYSTLPELQVGSWEIHDTWKGTILPLDHFAHLAYTDREGMINRFIRESYEAFTKLIRQV